MAGDSGGSGQYWLRAERTGDVHRRSEGDRDADVRARTYTDMRDGSTVLVANVTQSRKWLRSGVIVVGATGTTYLLGALDKGKAISLQRDGRAPPTC